MKKLLKKIPILGGVVQNIQNKTFPGSERYWEKNYKMGGNSGSGSYNRLAEFKAKIINDFISSKKVSSAIEFGCGDGNNLSLINYPKYIGLDVSPTAIRLCMSKFENDSSKSFYVYNSLSFIDNHALYRADLALSLDVIYHLIEDDIFIKYMTHLFQSSQKYVIIYSRDYSEKQFFHQKSRNFSGWITENQKSFRLINKIENPYKYDLKDPKNTTNADFYIYELND